MYSIMFLTILPHLFIMPQEMWLLKVCSYTVHKIEFTLRQIFEFILRSQTLVSLQIWDLYVYYIYIYIIFIVSPTRGWFLKFSLHLLYILMYIRWCNIFNIILCIIYYYIIFNVFFLESSEITESNWRWLLKWSSLLTTILIYLIFILD